MSDQKTTLEELITTLKKQRDELQLQMHLGSMEAKDEYDRLSERVDELARQFEPACEAVGETAGNLFAALGLAADEMKVGFDRVRKAVLEK